MKRILTIFFCLLLLSSHASATSVAHPHIGSGSAGTVKLDMRGITADIVLAQNSVSKEANAANMISAAGRRGTLLTAINGGAFNSSYERESLPGYGKAARCYANVIRNGMLINGTDRSSVYLGFTEDGRAMIGEVSATLYVSFGGRSIPIHDVNSYDPEPGTALLFTPEAGYNLPVPANAKAAKIVNGRVVQFLSSGIMSCAENTYYYVCGRNLYDQLPSIGDTVSFRTEFDKAAWRSVVTAVSCYPWLLHDGQDALEENVRLGYYSDTKALADATAGRSFAAILDDGSLMLGVCTATPRQLIQYLQSIHAKDALLLDGGASSMLYADGSLIRSAGRNLSHILCFYEGAPAQSADNTVARIVLSKQALLVNGEEKKADMYNIDGVNYFKLRDVAALLTGTASQFSVSYDAARSTIVVRTGAAYLPIGGELVPGPDQSAGAVPSSQRLEIDGATVSLSSYNIGGANYFKLRELGNALHFTVDYDEASSTVLIRSR